MIKRISLIFTLILLVILSSVFYVLNEKMTAPLPIMEPTLVSVDAGDSINRFSRKLKKMHWVSSSFWIKAYVRLNPKYANIKVGTYQATAQDSIQSLLKKIQRGQEHQFHITLIEGLTLKEWLIALSQHDRINKTQHTQSIVSISRYLDSPHKNPEGLFFPDTYAFTANTNDIDILKRAHLKMNDVLNEQWVKRATGLPYKTPYEALIMASIIEKETAKLEEQPRISSVFVNRLDKKMRLQTDPTIIYGLGDRFKGDITRAHMREKTAYNTYRINGLPPTPIAMPGLSAIHATLNPDGSDYLYFVSRGNGEHKFSKTLKEHNAAVVKYQLGRN